MWNEPTEEELSKLPKLYETENTQPLETMIHQHYFLGGCDWFAAEFGLEERIFFAFAILNGDLDNAEWGYVSLDEMRSLKTQQGFEVDRDLYWKPAKAGSVDKIAEAYRRKGIL